MWKDVIGSRVRVTQDGQDIIGRVMAMGCNGKTVRITYPDPEDKERGIIIEVPITQLKPASYLGGHNG